MGYHSPKEGAKKIFHKTVFSYNYLMEVNIRFFLGQSGFVSIFQITHMSKPYSFVNGSCDLSDKVRQTSIQ